jgi:hypothetical protein
MTRQQVILLIAVLAGIFLLPLCLLVLGAAVYFVMPSPSPAPAPPAPPVHAPDEHPVAPRPAGD